MHEHMNATGGMQMLHVVSRAQCSYQYDKTAFYIPLKESPVYAIVHMAACLWANVRTVRCCLCEK